MSSIAAIRALCARVLKADGEDFQSALEELDQAITAHILASPEREKEGTAKPPRERRS